MSTPIPLPLSQRQAEAVAKMINWALEDRDNAPTSDEWNAIREVAGKLDTMREK